MQLLATMVTLCALDGATTIDDAAIGSSITLPATGASVACLVTDRTTPGADRTTLRGTHDTGWFVVSRCGDAVRGTIRDGRDLLRLNGVATDDGIAWTTERVDARMKLPCHAPPRRPHVPAMPAEGCDDGEQIDLMLLYSPSARDAAGGVDEIVAEMDLWVGQTNQAFDTSDIPATVRAVFVGPAGTDDEQVFIGDLTSTDDGRFDHIPALRDAYAADLVAVVYDGAGGSAYGLTSLDDPSEVSAFSQNGLSSAGLFVLTHELGHNLGCCHALNDGGGCFGAGLLFEYSNGWRFEGDSETLWRTVMAYPQGELMLRFSSPAQTHDGQPVGDDGTPGADNAETIRLSANVVAARRCADPTCVDLDLPAESWDDCNRNGIPDPCDIAQGTSLDANGDGVPDECACPNDVVFDGVVDVNDLILMLENWGCLGPCAGDLDGDQTTGVDDLILLLAAWGGC